MRFLFYDRVTEIEKGKSIVGIKTFALSEEFLRRHFAKIAIVPGVILIESMAQLLGWLIIYSHDFKLSTILSLIEGVRVSSNLRPGFESHVHGEIVSTCHTDSVGRAWMIAGGEVIASMDRVIYSHLHKINPEELLQGFRYYSGRKGPGLSLAGDPHRTTRRS